jgi:HTH-type transcriptional regulator/antitoxin HigA
MIMIRAGGSLADSAARGDPMATRKKVLIRRFPFRPIRTDTELESAFEVIDELTDRSDLSSVELDYLDVLGDLVEKYEDETVEMPLVSDAKMLQSLIAEYEVEPRELVRRTGISQSALTLVLKGKRALTQEHIEALSKYFGVNPATFLGSGLRA